MAQFPAKQLLLLGLRVASRKSLLFLWLLCSCEETGGGPPGRARGPGETIPIGSNRPEAVRNVCFAKSLFLLLLEQKSTRERKAKEVPRPRTCTLIEQNRLVAFIESNGLRCLSVQLCGDRKSLIFVFVDGAKI